MITENKTMINPMKLYKLKDSEKNQTPIQTATTGSITPNIAAIVSPAYFIESINAKSETTVGRKASIMRYIHSFFVVIASIPVVDSAYIPNKIVPKNTI